jgi:hypothetical protein
MSDAAEELLRKINPAVKAMDQAREGYTSRSKIVGELLLEAKTLHPKVKDFEAFLKRVEGLHLSRAYELLKLAGGRTTEAELKKESRERQQRHRIKQKTKPTLPKPELKKPEPKPTPEPFRDVTEKPLPKIEPTTTAPESGWAETSMFRCGVGHLRALRGKPVKRFIGMFSHAELYEAIDFLIAVAAAQPRQADKTKAKAEAS